MTKKAAKKATDVAVLEKPGTQVAVKAAAGLPAYLANYKGPLGTENIHAEDVTIPRVKIGQSMSDEVKDGTVKERALFLNITGEVLAEPGAVLQVVPLVYAKEYILWRPRKDGGGILARAKPVKTEDGVRYKWDKPNSTFEVKVEGKTKVTWKTKNFIDEDGLDQWGSEIPGDKESGIAATVHHNFVVMLPGFDNALAAISMSRTAVGPAKDWNAILKRSSAPIFARVFNVTTFEDHRDDNKFGNYKVLPAGFASDEDFLSTYEPAAKAFMGKGFTVDHSDGDENTSTKDERL